jgi:tetratricopeptide (TPR) repeat protein
VQSAQGDLAGALKSYRDSLGIAEKLAKQDPGNADWQRNLSISYDRVGDVQSAQGDLTAALKSYRDSLGIREKLAKQDPGNAGWQRDLSVSYTKVGDVQSAQGDLTGALKSYRDSLGIAEKLAKQERLATPETFSPQQILFEVFELARAGHPHITGTQPVFQLRQHSQFIKLTIHTGIRENVRFPTITQETCRRVFGDLAGVLAIHGPQRFDRRHQGSRDARGTKVECL